ncbi:hypothetical protein Tco_0593770 [Tanacetum coccineum]
MVPRTVLTSSGLILVNTARLVNSVQPRTAVNNAGSMKNVINNAYSTARRPFNKITTDNNSNFTKKVNTIKGIRVNTGRPKAVISAVKGNKRNVVKALACWVWRPKHKVLDNGNPQQDLKNKGVINSGCSRHMTRNKSYLTDYEEIDGGFVAFGGNSKGGKITRKDFKLTDESHVLLKVPRKDNTYIVDFKNVVPQWGLTSRPNWLFDIVALTNSVNYKLVVAGNQSNGNASTKACNDIGKARMETISVKDYILLSVWPADPLFSQDSKSSLDVGFKPSGEEEKKDVQDPGNEDSEVLIIVVDPKVSIELSNDPNMPELEDIVYSDDDEDVGAKADMNNLYAFMPVSPIPTTRIHKDHLVDQIIRDLNSTPQTRRMIKNLKEHAQEGNLSIKRSKLDRSYARGASVVQVTTGSETRIEGSSKRTGEELESEILKKQKLDENVEAEVDDDKKEAEMKKHIEIVPDDEISRKVLFVASRTASDAEGSEIFYEVQDMYVTEFLKEKFGFSNVKNNKHTQGNPITASLPKHLLKDADVKMLMKHLYRSMIRSLMYLTSSRHDIMFATKIHIDNESTICIVKNPIFHSKIKHIEIRHHFIRDSYEKKLIQMIKIHIDQNVADLLTKVFDVSRFQYLIASIGMLNL